MNQILIALLIGLIAGLLNAVPVLIFALVLGAEIGMAGAKFIGWKCRCVLVQARLVNKGGGYLS